MVLDTTISTGDDALAAWANNVQHALGDGNPAQGASYVVFLDGSTYKARNGTDGTIDYSGTDAGTVIQAAYDAMDDGELLQLKEAIYDYTTGLVFDDKGKCVCGEGFRNTTLRYSGSGTAVTVGTASSETESYLGGLRNLRIYDKNGTAAVGLLVIQRYGVFENVYIDTVSAGVGLKIQPGSTSFSTYYNDFRSLNVYECLNGIMIDGNATKGCNANRFFGGEVSGRANAAGSVAIDINYGDTNMFYGTSLDDFETAIDLDANSHKNYFMPVRIEDMTNGAVVAGDRNWFQNINFNVTGTELTVSGDENRFLFCEFPGSPTITDTGSNNIYKNCRNYITESSGNSTGTGAQQSIAHGLNVIPDRLQLTNIEDGANPYRSASSDATNIYVTAVNAKAYTWKAWKA